MKVQVLQNLLMAWYKANKRPMPWRKNRHAYNIWISEVMLQQTTSTAVIPYYNKFIKAFPTVQKLATSDEKKVLQHWAGLGYYSRARNLHTAARLIHKKKAFPSTAAQLIQLPGFGPYISRAVSSQAFLEKVGVLDGNVIRLMSRLKGEAILWWNTEGRKKLQSYSDEFCQVDQPGEMNQALMELGATICLPKKPHCLICPWMKACRGRINNQRENLPLKKPTRKRENWIWKPHIVLKNKKLAIIKNTYAPFLKNQWILPGQVRQSTCRPKSYDFRHCITHHDIFVKLNPSSKYSKTHLNLQLPASDIKWIARDELSQWIPASLIKKVLDRSSI